MNKRDFLKAGAAAGLALPAAALAQQTGPTLQLENGDRRGRAAR